MKSSSSEEFEDAVDTLAPLPSTTRPNDFGMVTPRSSVISSKFYTDVIFILSTE